MRRTLRDAPFRSLSRERMAVPTTADNGDPIFRNLDRARRRTGTERISLGVCRQRCSPLPHRKPLAFAWRGGALASSHSCPICGASLLRKSAHRWAGHVQVLRQGR